MSSRASSPRARRRGVRVTALLAILIVLSAADLALTLIYMTEVGMFEANPVARAVLGSGSAWTLILWKFATTALAGVILWSCRRRWQGEAAAWICTGILGLLTVHWLGFIESTPSLTPELSQMMSDLKTGRGGAIEHRPGMLMDAESGFVKLTAVETD